MKYPVIAVMFLTSYFSTNNTVAYAAGVNAAGADTDMIYSGEDSAAVCIVEGEVISSQPVTFMYFDKEYTFCCDGCVMLFKKEPAKYIKGGLTCAPCSGEDGDAGISAVHEGVKYYFCGKGCLGKFEDNPGKYTDKYKPKN